MYLVLTRNLVPPYAKTVLLV